MLADRRRRLAAAVHGPAAGCHPDLRLRAHARADLAAWLDHEAATAYLAPGHDRAAAFDHLVEDARPVLGEGRTRLLRFHTGLSA
ncbi:hypothetical protein Ahu01nite_000980 [Winogradskya humida]|uniref:Uncharacterized protein n=1 Tax=Winogradskya humida TaxID=113566 RepID=A0ABQ3ZEI8_9ACTN|nr:hypothetical protein Ahu01nite_000980 [Actinoplanes humidus]